MAQFVSYGSYDSILVVNEQGNIRQVYTPFRVYMMNDKGQKQIYFVEEVKSTPDDKLIYMICNQAYYHHYFMVDIHF